MKTRYAWLLCLAFYVINPMVLRARHLVGNSISYEYLGDSGAGKHWRFTITMMRDCITGGALFDPEIYVAIYRGTLDNNVLDQVFPIQLQSIEPLFLACAFEPLPNVCYERARYTFERILPVLDQQNYFIVTQRCCMSPEIRNIVAPDNNGVSIWTTLTPEAMKGNNNSLAFVNIPPLYATKLGGVKFQPILDNKDGDSVHFRLIAPYLGGGSLNNAPALYSCEGIIPNPPCPPPYAQTQYNQGYFAQRPFGQNDSLNTATGSFIANVDLIGQYTIGIEADEYRNGVLLGSTFLQFTVVLAAGGEGCALFAPAVGTQSTMIPKYALAIAPNPSFGQTSLSISPEVRLVQVEVLNALGQLQARWDWPEAAETFTLDTHTWPAGLYTVRARDVEGKVYVTPLVCQGH